MDSRSRALVPSGGPNALDAYPLDTGLRPWVEPREPPKGEGWWATIARHRVPIFGLILLCAAVGLVASLLSPPVYRAEANVEFQQVGTPAAPGRGDDSLAARQADELRNTQLQFVTSRSLAERVAASLPAGSSAYLLSSSGRTDAGPKPSTAAVAPVLQNNVDVYLNDNSRVATITFDSQSPEMSALVANSYVDNFIEAVERRQSDALNATRQFLEGRLAEAKTRLEGSESALINYTRRARLIDSSAGTSSVSGGSSPRSLSSEKLMQMSEAHSGSRAERIAAEQRWREAQRTPLMSLPEVLSNPAIQQLTQKGAEAQAALEQARQRRTDDHPAVREAAAHIAEINRQKEVLAGSIRESIRERYEVARREEGQLAGNVSRLENETLADQGKGVRYNVLKRDADTNRQVYDTLLQRLNEASVAVGMPAYSVSVVDRAQPPAEAVAPKPAETTALGGAAGLALSLLYLFGVRLLDDGVHSPDELDAKLKVPLIGVLPWAKRPMEALEDPASPLSEAHYSLRTTLELTCNRTALRTILFTSSTEGEGKTAAACGAARNFALSGRRVLIIDADMRKPSVHRQFGLEPGPGLSSVLAGHCAALEAIVDTSVAGLSVLMSGPIPPSAAALLSGSQFRTTLKELTKAFDVIIIDAPPVFGLADGPRLAAAASITVFIVEAARAKMMNVKAALRRLAEAKANVVGAVLTKFDVRASGSGANLYVYEYRSDSARERLTAG